MVKKRHQSFRFAMEIMPLYVTVETTDDSPLLLVDYISPTLCRGSLMLFVRGLSLINFVKQLTSYAFVIWFQVGIGHLMDQSPFYVGSLEQLYS